MPYDNTIPKATDAISASQQQMLDNFAAIQALFEVNHVNFNQANQGKHKWVTFPIQNANPVTIAGEVAQFSKVSTYTGTPELCVRRQNNGPVIEMTSALTASPGWAFTSSGILLKWGTGLTVAGDFPGGTTLAFPVAATIPVFGTVLSAYVTTSGAAGADIFAMLRAFTNVDITVLGVQRTANVGAAVNYQYLVMGLL